MKTILIVEDEPAIQDMLSLFLRSEKFEVAHAYDYVQASDYLSAHRPDLILLDWMIPKGSGLQLLTEIRNSQEERIRTLPVIMLTARTELEDKLSGLNIGADDYLTKPFALKELLARIQSVLRRTPKITGEASNNQVWIDTLCVDIDAHRLMINGQTVAVGRMEFKLLSFLITHLERVYSRAQLLDYVWGTENYVDERTVDVAVGRLRKTLEPFGYEKMLQTVRGEGYRFSKK